MLRQLREQHLKRGPISNQREPLGRLTIELGIIEHFGFTLAVRKSAAAAIQRCGVHPEEAIQVDENEILDVSARTNV